MPWGAVAFKGPMLYELPYAIEKLNASAADQVELAASDSKAMTAIIDALQAARAG